MSELTDKLVAAIGHADWCHGSRCDCGCTPDMADCDVWATVAEVMDIIAEQREQIAQAIEADTTDGGYIGVFTAARIVRGTR